MDVSSDNIRKAYQIAIIISILNERSWFDFPYQFLESKDSEKELVALDFCFHMYKKYPGFNFVLESYDSQSFRVQIKTKNEKEMKKIYRVVRELFRLYFEHINKTINNLKTLDDLMLAFHKSDQRAIDELTKELSCFTIGFRDSDLKMINDFISSRPIKFIDKFDLDIICRFIYNESYLALFRRYKIVTRT